MNKQTVFKVFGYALIFLCAIVVLDLLMSAGDAQEVLKTYDSVQVDSTAGTSKKMLFLQDYTRISGDTTLAIARGVDVDTANSWANPESPGNQNGEGGNVDVEGSITSSDITAIAKAVCTSYVGSSSSTTDLYVGGAGGTLQNTPYSNVTYNSRVLVPYTGSNGYYYRCCNGLSSAILFLCNITTYNNGSNINGNWPYISCEDIYQKIGTQISATKFGDLKVGDIICVKGSDGKTCHVETVVKIEGTNVYIASAGSSDGIRNTATNGYHRCKDASQDLDTFYSSSGSWYGLRGVVRP